MGDVYSQTLHTRSVVWTLSTGTCTETCANLGSSCSEFDLTSLTHKQAAEVAFQAAGITCKAWNSWNYKQGVSQCTASTCCNGDCVGHCSVPSAQVGSYPPSVMCYIYTPCTCLRTVKSKIGFAQITYKPPTNTEMRSKEPFE